MKIIKRGVIKGLYKLGYNISKKDDGITYLPITNYSEAIYTRKNVYFDVDIDIICTMNQFFFSPKKWHFFTRMVEEIIRNQNVEYSGSVLEKYYESYKPNSLKDFYFWLNETVDLSIEDDKTMEENINTYLQNSPWSDVRDKVKMEDISEGGLAYWHGHQGYGPVTKDKGELEIKRLKDTYVSIKTHGYQPSKYDGHIQGHFLRYKDKHRFIITGGVHRTAVIAALGYDKIHTTFSQNWPRVIDFNDIPNLPLVRQGVFSKCLAEQIFLTYFNENGINKATKLGLI